MRTSGLIIGAGIFFFIPIAFVYGYLTDFQELVGFPAIALVGLMSLMIGGYVYLQDKQMGKHPQDIDFAEISDEAYEYGFYSPGAGGRWHLLQASVSASWESLSAGGLFRSAVFFAWWL